MASIPGPELCAYYRDLMGMPSRAQDPFRVVFRVTERRVRALGVGLIEIDGPADNDNRRPKHPPHLRPC